MLSRIIHITTDRAHILSGYLSSFNLTYRNTLRRIVKNNYRKYALLLIVATIPTGIIGVLGKKLRPIPVLASLGALLAIGWDRFYWYYFSPYARGLARGQFAYNSIRIAKDYFPLGTGFGTFGSRAAQIWYSPVYYWYDMYRTNGMDPLWPAYACDTFWPMILGESGVIGLLAYAGLVIVLFIAVLRLQKKGAWIFTAALAAFLYELIETTGALAFSDPAAVQFALLLGLAFGIAKEEAA